MGATPLTQKMNDISYYRQLFMALSYEALLNISQCFCDAIAASSF
jgi:hypothetical protein